MSTLTTKPRLGCGGAIVLVTGLLLLILWYINAGG